MKRKWIIMLTSSINLNRIIHCTIWLVKINKTVIPFFWTQSFYLLSYVLRVASDNLYNFAMSAVWLRVRIPVHAPIWRSELWILSGHDGKSEPLFHSLPILLHCSWSSLALFLIFKAMNIWWVEGSKYVNRKSLSCHAVFLKTINTQMACNTKRKPNTVGWIY